MLQPNPETTTLPTPLRPTREPDYLEYRPSRKRFDNLEPLENITYNPVVEKLAKRRSLARKAIAGVLATSTTFFAYLGDTNMNIQREQQAEATVSVVAPALSADNNGRAILFFDGFNANRAEYLSSTLGPGIEENLIDGQIWATNYNNDPANREKIYEINHNLIQERNIDNLVVFAHSKGGVNGVQLTVDTITNSWVDVDAIILSKTPSGFDGLRDYKQDELQLGMIASNVWRLRYSTPARIGLEMLFNQHKFTQGGVIDNIENFFEELTEVTERFNSSDLTTTSFLIEQVDDINKANFADEFSKLTELEPTKQMPVIVYLGTAEPAYDAVVDDKKSGDEICAAAEENGLTCIRDEVESFHSLYYQSVDKFNETYARIGDELRDAIAKEQARVAISRFEIARKENR